MKKILFLVFAIAAVSVLPGCLIIAKGDCKCEQHRPHTAAVAPKPDHQAGPQGHAQRPAHTLSEKQRPQPAPAK